MSKQSCRKADSDTVIVLQMNEELANSDHSCLGRAVKILVGQSRLEPPPPPKQNHIDKVTDKGQVTVECRKKCEEWEGKGGSAHEGKASDAGLRWCADLTGTVSRAVFFAGWRAALFCFMCGIVHPGKLGTGTEERTEGGRSSQQED